MLKRIFLLLLCAFAGCASLKIIPMPEPKREPAGISMDAGDLSGVHPIEKPSPHVERIADAVPQDVKDHTYLFFINGLDPYYLANFRGQCQYLKSLGYNNAYLGQMSHADLFGKMIKEIRKNDSRAQIAVVGYSFGANSVRTLANALKADSVHVDLVVYLGGDTIKNVDFSRPPNVGRVVNICGHGSFFLGYDLLAKGEEINGAVNHRLDSRHFLLPTRAESTELLVKHIADMNGASASDIRRVSFHGRF